MNLDIYFNKKRELYEVVLSLIENDTEEDFVENLQNLKEIIEKQQIYEDKESFKKFLQVMLKIFKNHYRHSQFFSNFKNILQFLKEEVTQSFSNYEIFILFKSNKLILLFLSEAGILKLNDNKVLSDLLEKRDKSKFPYYHYFYPEIKEFIDAQLKQKIEHELFDGHDQLFNEFLENRQKGLNDSYISSLIQEDSVEEFISYINRKSISMTSEINMSLFETNQLLMKNQPTLIEYSAFYGSIQIFQFLRLNNIELKPSIWLYAIHGRNAELIHILEENKVAPPDDTYYRCLEESIKCHHNDIANYIYDNLIDKNDENYFNNIESYCFHYLDFDLLPHELNEKYLFCYMCQFDYFEIVNFLMSNKSTNINYKIVFE